MATKGTDLDMFFLGMAEMAQMIGLGILAERTPWALALTLILMKECRELKCPAFHGRTG